MLNSMKALPIGYEDFKEIIDGKLYYVDKSMLIYEIIRNQEKNMLITRPRRFGKTLNMSMLKYFFDINEKDNAYLFDGLEISKHYDELSSRRNAYPVISLSFKETKQKSFNSALYNIRLSIQSQYKKYKSVLNSDCIDIYDRQLIEEVMDINSSAEVLSNSIKLLSSCLYQYYGAKAIILIDEYDVPLESACLNGYYDEMVDFVRTLFSSALKTNSCVELSVITGCLRASKESIFTGWNNAKIYSVLSARYSSFMGFTPDEVKSILKFYDLENKMPVMKEWYDGYIFGKSEIYNPWSVLNQTAEWIDTNGNGAAKTWWINTSGNDIIQRLIEFNDDTSKEKIERLIQGECIQAALNENVTYGDILNDRENIWSFLYFTGYLKIRDTVSADDDIYTLEIPNLEVEKCYKKIIHRYFRGYARALNKTDLYSLLLKGHAEEFADKISAIMEETISFFDTAENFYHGFLAGILSEFPNFRVKSNRESGKGRTDLTIFQKYPKETAVILEFKVCGNYEEMSIYAQKALRQINDNGYDAEAKSERYKHIIKYGIAFCKKACYAVCEK